MRLCKIILPVVVLLAFGPAQPLAAQELPEPQALADALTGKAGAERSLPRSVIFRKPDKGAAVLGYRIRFAHDSSAISKEASAFLDRLGAALKLPELASETLVVEGHTDATGSEAYNDGLSLRRARAVANYLTARQGIPVRRLLPLGRGELEPLLDADPEHPGNRRVEFYLPGAKGG